MDEKEIDYDKYEIKKARETNIGAFIKQHLTDGLIIIVSIVYVFYGLITIKQSDKTILEIIATGSITAAMGLLIKYIFSIKGISNGYASEIYTTTLNSYTTNVDSISDNIDKLDVFCDYKNLERLTRQQRKILTRNHMTLEKYLNGEYDGIEKYKDVIKKVKAVSIYELDSDILTAAYSDRDREQNILNKSTGKYLSKSWIATLLFAVVFMFLFGLFEPETHTLNWQNVIWSGLQVCIFLIFGAVKYFQSYNFITVDMVAKLKRIEKYVQEFKATLVNKPQIYENKNVEDEVEKLLIGKENTQNEFSK